MISFKTTKRVLLFLIFAVLVLPSFVVNNVSAEPIPAGCPESANPTIPAPDICATIPLGCPGSSLSGPVAQIPDSCPYTNDGVVNDGNPIDTDCNSETLDSTNCGIIDLLVNGINFLTALAGMAIVASIMYSGFQYMIAQDNSGMIQAARTRIIWAIVALLMLIFTYAFLNWVVPGGVL